LILNVLFGVSAGAVGQNATTVGGKVGMGKNDPKFEQNKQSWTKSQGKKRITRKNKQKLNKYCRF
jgi:hypothetical protein